MNGIRRELLAEHREYGRNSGLFEGFPESISWDRVTLDPADLWSVKYIDWSYWTELSEGSRLPRDAADLIRAARCTGNIAPHGELGLVWPSQLIGRRGWNWPAVRSVAIAS
ncbi:MAG: hypothetical protein HN712_06510 [Gemmatimonadetes bacterium]|nr:hypothetical protein [Gemmatimonadota bacterium]